MGLGLWHYATSGVLQAQFAQSSGADIPVKLGDSNDVSWLSEMPRSKRAHFVDLALEHGEDTKCLRKEGDYGCELRSSGRARRVLSSRGGAKSSRRFAGRSRVRRTLTSTEEISQGSKSLWWSDLGERTLGSSIVASASSGFSFWHPFWENAGNSKADDSLEISEAGDGSSGNDGSGWEIEREVLVSNGVEKEEGDDEQQHGKEAPVKNLDQRAPVLASLTSTSGDASGGKGPFDNLPLGRNNRAGAAEHSSAKVPSKASDKGYLVGSNGMENERVALKDEASAYATQIIQQNNGDETPAKSSEIAALRRLQRETFSDLLGVRERLDRLEFHTGLRPSKGQTSLEGGGAKTKLKGEVCSGGAFVLLDDESSRHSRAALEQAGLHTGLDVRFTFETSYRERDVMITECSAGHSGSDGSILGGPISVTKLVYNAQVTDDLNVVVAPLGARGSDITETVNPLQGHALTQFAKVGPSMYHDCVGSALGATLRGKTALVSLSQFLSGWGTGSLLSDGPANSGPLCLSTLAHIMFQPWENSVFSLSAVNRFWPSPPLPSFRGLHWSEMGPLVLSKSHHSRKNSGSSSPPVNSPRDFRIPMDSLSMYDFRTSMDTRLRDFRTSSDNPSGYSANASWGTPNGEPDRGIITIPETHGSAMQSIAVAGEIDVGANVSLAGWAQADREYWLQEGENREIEWTVSLTKTVGTTAGWGLCVGSSKVDLWNSTRNEDLRYTCAEDGLGGSCDMQLQMEAFLKLSMGRGFTLQPGLVYLLNKQSQTPAFVLRSSWAL